MGALSSVQVHSVLAPEFSGGAAFLSVPGMYCRSVAAGTVVHGSGTCCNSPSWKLVTKLPKPRLAAPGPPLSR